MALTLQKFKASSLELELRSPRTSHITQRKDGLCCERQRKVYSGCKVRRSKLAGRGREGSARIRINCGSQWDAGGARQESPTFISSERLEEF